MNYILAVFIGGGVGSLARYGVSVIGLQFFRTSFPVATLLSNVLSCLVMAIAIGFFSLKLDSNMGWKMLLITGFCGGFSTFSTFSYETVELIRSGNTSFAIVNVVLSLLTCFSLIFFLAKSNVV